MLDVCADCGKMQMNSVRCEKCWNEFYCSSECESNHEPKHLQSCLSSRLKFEPVDNFRLFHAQLLQNVSFPVKVKLPWKFLAKKDEEEKRYLTVSNVGLSLYGEIYDTSSVFKPILAKIKKYGVCNHVIQCAAKFGHQRKFYLNYEELHF